MPKFYDAISFELHDINRENTGMVFYAVKTGEKYRLAGCTETEFQLLKKDPETRISDYYPVNAYDLLDKDVFEVYDAAEMLDAYGEEVTEEEYDLYVAHGENDDAAVFKYKLLSNKTYTKAELSGLVNFDTALPFPDSPQGRARAARVAAVVPPAVAPVAAPVAAEWTIGSRIRDALMHLVLPNGNVIVTELRTRQRAGGTFLLRPPHEELRLPFSAPDASRIAILQNNMFAVSDQNSVDIYHAENGQLFSHSVNPAWWFNRVLPLDNGNIAMASSAGDSSHPLQIFSIDDTGGLIEISHTANSYRKTSMTEMQNHCVAIAAIRPEAAGGSIPLRIINPVTAAIAREINITDAKFMPCIKAIGSDQLAIVYSGPDDESYLSIYNTETGDRTASISLGRNYIRNELTCITILPNGFLGVASAYKSGIKIIDPSTEEVVDTLAQAFPITHESHFMEAPAFRHYVDSHPAADAAPMPGGM